ncbi:permease-like cell division protein FtsX [Planobispora longispora]|uniref:Cell division protein FtsX n=1 Tax=Planobispora longispora TaxID=28887 RepID=A0A8J3RGX1_9ACTN|nr:permease-like cell division protein FtsX [Planobispora longispora]GIH74565.1 cell division protein FtsX [Planobispora longispora]
MRANFIFSEVWIGLRRNLTMTIAVIVTVAIGMALLGIGLMVNSQVSKMRGFWSDKVEVSAFLCKKNDPLPSCKGSKGVTEQARADLQTRIQGMAQVESVEFENSATAYENFRKTYGENDVLVKAIQVEDMPESFRVKVKNPEEYGTVIDELQSVPGISMVVDERELLDGFFDLMEKIRGFALMIAGFLVLAVILLIGNTVRLSAYNRRRETGIMRLVGASNLYIQLPFVMEGVIAGLLGGVVSAVLLIVTKVFLFDSMNINLAAGTQLTWNDLAQVILGTMVIGVIICILASFVTLRRYLRV